ncbi:MAG: hypothetical protein ACJ759_25290 [Thermoanaerobaculia bacterium]
MNRPLQRCALAAFALFWAASGRAEIRVENFPIHHALYPEHASSSLLSAVIEEEAGSDGFLGLRTATVFRITVEQLILDRGWDLPEGAELQVGHLLWPDGLLDLRPGAKVFFIVRSGFPEPGDQYVSTVLPRSEDGLPRVRTERQAIRLLEKDLLAQIPAAGSDRQLVALLQTLVPILTRGSVREVEPLLTHGNREVRRAALGALFRVAPTAANARLVADDLRELFTDGPGRACVSPPVPYCELLEELFRSYPYLNPRSRRWGSRWDEEESAEYERLARMVLSSAQLPVPALRLLTVTE